MHTIHNARIQMLSLALNNLGVGAIIAGIVAPMVNGKVADVAHILVWLIFGAQLILLAQFWLGRLRT
jgi:hypothetical protein